jgi:Icc-related predicted phosphoesterase
MLLVADVHGAADHLRRVAAAGETVLVLGDLINFIDYRTMDGILADLVGREWVATMVELRAAGRTADIEVMWEQLRAGREAELRARHRQLVESAYERVCGALAGARAYVTYGNVDWPELLRRHLPRGAHFVDSGVVELEGLRVGMVGGGVTTGLGVPGEVDDDTMTDRLAGLGEVDVLCTHVPPAVGPLQKDVVGGRQKGSGPVLDYLLAARPRFHYFGDVHQPQALWWKVGDTLCRNVGYFRATGRAVRHPA